MDCIFLIWDSFWHDQITHFDSFNLSSLRILVYLFRKPSDHYVLQSLVIKINCFLGFINSISIKSKISYIRQVVKTIIGYVEADKDILIHIIQHGHNALLKDNRVS